jgi:hypothetical protein
VRDSFSLEVVNHHLLTLGRLKSLIVRFGSFSHSWRITSRPEVIVRWIRPDKRPWSREFSHPLILELWRYADLIGTNMRQ